mgnify:CR=1 FL=1
MRFGLPLATIDVHLRKAAHVEGIVALPAKIPRYGCAAEGNVLIGDPFVGVKDLPNHDNIAHGSSMARSAGRAV